MSTSVLQPLNSQAVYSRHASFLYVAYVLRPRKQRHIVRGWFLRPFFCEVFFFSDVFSVRRRVFPCRANTSACAFAPREHVVSFAGFQRFHGPLFFLFFTEDLSACTASESAPVVSSLRPSASQVRFRPVRSCSVPVPSSEVVYPGSRPLASGVFLHPTTRLLPRPLLGPQSLPSDSGFHQRRLVVSFGSHMFVHSHHRFPSALTMRTS